MTAHFHVVKGRAYSFRFKDWNDFNAADQAMAQITPTVWQIVKRYKRSGYEHVRTITKPVAGSVAVKIAGSPVAPAAVDTLMGRITFAPAPGSAPTAAFPSASTPIVCRFRPTPGTCRSSTISTSWKFSNNYRDRSRIQTSEDHGWTRCTTLATLRIRHAQFLTKSLSTSIRVDISETSPSEKKFSPDFLRWKGKLSICDRRAS